MKSTVAAVGNSAVRLGHLKETTTVDRQVQRVVGGLQATGCEVLLRTDNAHTGTQLQTGWQLAVLSGLGTRLAFDLVQQVLKLGTVTLETCGRNVRQVVGDGGQVGVLSGKTGFSDV